MFRSLRLCFRRAEPDWSCELA